MGVGLMIAAGGCGSIYVRPAADATRPLVVAGCDADPDRLAVDLVVLDWSGGVTPIYPDDDFPPLDLSTFITADGRTLADDAERFMESVRTQVQRIYCESDGPCVRVEHAADATEPAGATVYFTQAVSPVASGQVGEGEYDPCNRQHDNAAVLFGERIRLLGGAYTFDEWVNVFANITAHEVGHALGYGHVMRAEWQTAGRSLYVELMLDGHTMGELRREQRFLTEPHNCPDSETVARRQVEDPNPTGSMVDTAGGD